jgi:hypothetical protein
MDVAHFDRWTKAVMRTRLSRRQSFRQFVRPAAAVTVAASAANLLPAQAAAQATGEGTCCVLIDETEHQVVSRICAASGASCGSASTGLDLHDYRVSTCNLCPPWPMGGA